jgi:hypothetical protein
MADNVMALVKKKGEKKKLRGRAAQIAQRREEAEEARRKAEAERRRHEVIRGIEDIDLPDKPNQFRNFLLVDFNDMKDELEKFIEEAGWTTMRPFSDINYDNDMIRIFNILMTSMPFPLVKTIFEEFDESPVKNFITFFNEFILRPDVIKRRKSMKELIKRRQAIPLHIPKTLLQEKGVQEHPKQYTYTRVKNLMGREIIPTKRPNLMFGSGDILSRCEREYRRAPWMFIFTDKVIRGFAIKGVDPEYTIPEEVKDDWYKVNMRWYRNACAGKRYFVPDKIGYVTIDKDIIIETKEMFETSQKNWLTEFTPLDPRSFDIAKRMLMDNKILQKSFPDDSSREQYVTAILSEFGNIVTNYEMARKISYVLVFLTDLIDENQIYHSRIKNKQYRGNVLINLDRYTMLPEIFRNPNIDKTPIETKIKRKRRVIENQFYDNLKIANPNLRRRLNPAPVEAPPSKDNRISAPAVLPSSVASLPREQRSSVELAPGLFEKLRDRISRISECHFCHEDVLVPPYSTVRGEDRLEFCSKNCFDNYDI